MLTQIDHLVIATDDLEAAQAQCVALLGRSPSWSGSHPAFGTRNVIFRLANSYIELLAPGGEGPAASDLSAHLDAEGPGLFALALATEDAGAAVTAMRERGLSPSEPVEALAHDDPSGAFRRFRNVWLPAKDTRGIRLFVIEHLSEPELLPLALPVGEPGAVVERVDHVVLMTREPDQAVTFYGEQLGIRLALDRTFEARGLRLLFFRLGGTTLEISAPVGDKAELGASETAAENDRLWGVAYSVADAEAARSRMLEAGLKTSEMREGHKPGTRVFSVKENPLGVPTLVIQPATV
ncbi:MAG: VOC family protein [Myxococcota bacterium]|nr:VOC family protein [Myxococcota bacterium]